MAFNFGAQRQGTQPTNNFSKFTPSTDGFAMFNGEKMLRVSYYDNSMKIEIRTRLADGSGKFGKPEPKDEIAVLLTQETAAALERTIRHSFIPMLEEMNELIATGRTDEITHPRSVGMVTKNTGDKVIEISTGMPGQNGIEPVIMLHLDINEERVPGRTDAFVTKSTSVIIDYDGGKNTEPAFDTVYPQFVLFMNALQSFVANGSKAALHFSKSYQTNHAYDVLDRIAEAAGVPISRPVPVGGYQNKFDNGSNAIQNPTAVNYSQASLNDIV